jgi:hypothetical protein
MEATMQTHIVENGVVVNTILASVEETTAAYPSATCIDGSVGGIGWLWDGETLTQPVAPPPPPRDIKAEIATLEASITERRKREAMISGDYSFIIDIDTQIAALRSQL